MNMTIILFQIDFDAFSAMAVDVDRSKHIWKAKFDSLEDLFANLKQTRAVTSEEAKKLSDGTWFQKGAPILRVVDTKDIESAGFVQVLPVSVATGDN